MFTINILKKYLHKRESTH